MVKKSLLSFLCLIILTGYSIPANAGYNGDTVEVETIEYSFNLFPRHFYTIKLFNNPAKSETKFTLRIASYGEVSGCASMSESLLEAKEVSGTIKLIVTDSEVMLDDDPRYSPYDCEIKNNRSFFDVELDRDELISKGIKHIKLKSESYGDFMTSDIEVSKHKIELSVKNTNNTFMASLWFLPKNAVVLHVPNAKLGQKVQEEIKKFGLSQGLVAMDDAYKGFEQPYSANSYAFFTDPSKHIFRQLSALDENIIVGNINLTRTIYGANGTMEEPYSLEVYATLPGKAALEKAEE